MINYPSSEQQRARVDAHAKAAVMMAAILLAAGAFTGIMKGSGHAGSDGRRGRRAPFRRRWRRTCRSFSA